MEARPVKPTFRASESDRVLTCHGSVVLVPLVAPRESEDGAEGSHLHFQSALEIIRDLGGTGDIGQHDPAWPSLKFSKWISSFYVRHISESTPDGWSLECEVPLAYEFDRFILSGHIDCLAVSPDATECIGFDLKTGFLYTDEAETNEQVFSYCCLLKRAYPTLKKIQFYITQPRAADEDEGQERISRVVLEGDRLERANSVLEQRFNAALDGSMTVNTGRKQCRFCDAATQCPALLADREIMKLQLTDAHLAAIKRTPDDATLANWVISAKTLERPMEDAKELAKERIAISGGITASDGTQITVKTSKGSYKVLNPDGLWATLHELLPAPMLATCAKWSFSNVRDKIAEHMGIPKTGKAAVTSESVFDSKIRQHVEQGERKTFQYL